MTLDEWVVEAERIADAEFFGPVSDGQILAASRSIGLPFPEQYREFLSRLGCGSVGSESFIGLGGPQDLDVTWVCEALRANSRQKPLPPSLIPLRADGFGNYDAIDTAQRTAEDEFRIVEWRHEGIGSQGSRVLAESYNQWLGSMLDLIREAAR
jgi:hypothetical protein